MGGLLLWDFDGTLAYRQGGMFSAALLETLQGMGRAEGVSIEQLRPYLQAGFPWHTPDRLHPDLCGADAWWEALYPVFERALAGLGWAERDAHVAARQVRAVYVDPQRWALYQDTLPALKALAERGWLHAVLSNHVPELRAIAEALGLAPRLAALFSSAETGCEKPHPRAFELALEAFPGAAPVWMIAGPPTNSTRFPERNTPRSSRAISPSSA